MAPYLPQLIIVSMTYGQVFFLPGLFELLWAKLK